MRKLLALLFTALLLQAPAFALVGGPWGNNSHENNSDGVFSAVMVMKNGSGIARWAQLSGIPEISRFSESVVWYRGAVYFGTTFGLVDMVSRTVTGITEGEVTASGVLQGTKAAGPVAFCNTQWSGKVKDVRRSLYFTAKGVATFFGDYSDQFLPATNIQTTETVNGPLNAQGIPTFITVTVTTQDIPGAGLPNAAFPEYRTRTRVFVFGSRTSAVGVGFPSLTGGARIGIGADAAAAAAGGGGGGGGGGN